MTAAPQHFLEVQMTTTVFGNTELGRNPSAVVPSLSALRARMTRSLATLLLAAAVAAVAVAADWWVETWADGHPLTAWAVIWAVVFAGSLLLAGTARRIALRTLTGLDQWARERVQARAEARLRELVKGDERLLADISLAVDAAVTPAAEAVAPDEYDADAARSANIDDEISASTLRMRRARALM